MWNIFFHVFEDFKIQHEDILQLSKKSWQKKKIYFFLGNRRNVLVCFEKL